MMFERRLKIVLVLAVAVTAIFVMRAFWLQVVQHDEWAAQASESMKRVELVDPPRGRILDFNGNVLAMDEPSYDAAVDFRAIVKDEAWMRQQAGKRLDARRGPDWRGGLKREQVKAVLDAEQTQVERDIDLMWPALASAGGVSTEDVMDSVRSITSRVEMRRKAIMWRNFRSATDKHEKEKNSPEENDWWKQWIIGDRNDAPREEAFQIDVAEQFQAHVVLRAISNDANVRLAKAQDTMPGLVLRASKHRRYPFGASAAHVLGHLSRVMRSDLRRDPNVARDDARQYYPNDLIGRSGVEALAEDALRGSRGRIERMASSDERVMRQVEPAAGRDVRTSLDIVLQKRIEDAFTRVRVDKKDASRRLPMHGAAVVIDIATGQVRAMVSAPSFDPNDLERDWRMLSEDRINSPLLHRATSSQLEPGSTMKPVVGLAGVGAGLTTPQTTIHCDGNLYIGGRRMTSGRCWTLKMFKSTHQAMPSNAPHPTGHLTLEEAIERSCNVYFEVIGYQLGINGLSEWARKFGLGRRTGIGIAEADGHLPDDDESPVAQDQRASTAWFAAIGQGRLNATPLQMANVAATLARNGVWKRPTLLVDEADRRTRAEGPDTVDLKLPAEALAATRRGMIKVVNGPAGTGATARHTNVLVAGKTGTAQAQKFSIPRTDPVTGLVLRDERGRVIRQDVAIGTIDAPNPLAPWYIGFRGNDPANPALELTHGWFMGYAPADNPTIAFAVMVEYGGAGGLSAGSVAQELLDAAIELGYIKVNK